eukprot:COSAG04_NODE_21230_length_377_cov_1.820144_1_plen_41_part_01
MTGAGAWTWMAPEPEPSFLGELASGIWAGLKVSVPGLALAA